MREKKRESKSKSPLKDAAPFARLRFRLIVCSAAAHRRGPPVHRETSMNAKSARIKCNKKRAERDESFPVEKGELSAICRFWKRCLWLFLRNPNFSSLFVFFFYFIWHCAPFKETELQRNTLRVSFSSTTRNSQVICRSVIFVFFLIYIFTFIY